MARAKKQNTTNDPVFIEIKKYQKSMRELYEALKPVARYKGSLIPRSRPELLPV